MSDPISPQASKVVRHFRQILLWPLQLMPIREGAQIQKHWELLQTADSDNPWREVADGLWLIMGCATPPQDEPQVPVGELLIGNASMMFLLALGRP